MNLAFGPLKRSWLLAALFAVLPLVSHAQTVPDWTAATPGTNGVMLALDRANNTYVAGSISAATMQVSKIGPNGATLWQRSFSTPGLLSKSLSATVDGAGNLIVTGMQVDAVGTPMGPVLLKYDAAGTLLWQDSSVSTYGYLWRAATDLAGNVYVLARTAQTSATGAITLDLVLSKYSPAGVREWNRSFGASRTSDEPMVVTPAGTVVVSGIGSVYGQVQLAAFDTAGNPLLAKSVLTTTDLSLALGRGGELYAVGSAGPGFLVIKHDAAFNELWRYTFPTKGYALRAAVDSLGNLVVSGYFDTNTGLALVLLNDWLTLKLDPNGVLLWSRSYGQPGGVSEMPYGLALGADDAVYLTGAGSVTVFDPVLGGTITKAGVATLKYAADGTQLWAVNTPVANRGVGLKLGSDGGVLVLAEAPQTLLRYPQSGAANLPPVARASASPSAGIAPLTVNFSSAGSSDPDGLVTGWLWDFGDGQSSTLANPSHSYAAGSWTARLTVTDSLGAASAAAPIVISSNLVVPVAPAQPSALVLAKASVGDGSSTTGVVTVSSKSGVTLALSSSSAAVRVPATLVIPAGATRASFVVLTSQVRKDTLVTIRASANGAAATALLIVRAR